MPNNLNLFLFVIRCEVTSPKKHLQGSVLSVWQESERKEVSMWKSRSINRPKTRMFEWAVS